MSSEIGFLPLSPCIKGAKNLILTVLIFEISGTKSDFLAISISQFSHYIPLVPICS